MHARNAQLATAEVERQCTELEAQSAARQLTHMHAHTHAHLHTHTHTRTCMHAMHSLQQLKWSTDALS